eukprot:8707584-Ditylum_brightwellii.AAC.1
MHPVKGSPFYFQATATFDQLADALHTNLNNPQTISVNKAPKPKHKRHNPSFFTLQTIIFDLSPYLGGK